MGRKWAIAVRQCIGNLQNTRRQNKNAALAGAGRRYSFKAAAGRRCLEKWSGDEAKARRSHRAGLAGHGVGKTLTLESGGQVHFAAGKEAGKKLHDHLQSVAQTGRLRLMEWGSSFAAAHIGLCEQKLNRKSEALDMKCDTKCDKFEQAARNL
ncbi:hypothetical protein [Mesorhizobium erdmanii]|uniref:hypothetical protein n=1 Tax=Mesorhizobium erdmanii TaxID=1777866 RepID=UPI001427DE88|nr:hypothetical protein [Mesorhizobium erdmanii]